MITPQWGCGFYSFAYYATTLGRTVLSLYTNPFHWLVLVECPDEVKVRYYFQALIRQ